MGTAELMIIGQHYYTCCNNLPIPEAISYSNGHKYYLKLAVFLSKTRFGKFQPATRIIMVIPRSGIKYCYTGEI